MALLTSLRNWIALSAGQHYMSSLVVSVVIFDAVVLVAAALRRLEFRLCIGTEPPLTIVQTPCRTLPLYTSMPRFHPALFTSQHSGMGPSSESTKRSGKRSYR